MDGPKVFSMFRPIASGISSLITSGITAGISEEACRSLKEGLAF